MISVEYDDFNAINESWEVAFVGVHADERDIATKNFLTVNAGSLFTVEYDSDELCLLLDGQNVEIHELMGRLAFCKGKKVIIDATSMTVAEMFLLSKQLYSLSIDDYSVIYVEPKEYTKSEEDFLLSDSGIGFSGAGIPSLTVPFEQEEKKTCCVFIGV